MTAIGVDIYSHHFSSGFQNNTPGIYAKIDIGNSSDSGRAIAFGTYRNSVGNLSAHAGFAYTFNPYARVYAGIVTGYGHRAILFASPQLMLPVSREYNIVFSFIPATKINRSSVIHLSLEREF